MKRTLLTNLKNVPGWRTKEKLVVLAVDDYCNVRLDSVTARDRMIEAGIVLTNRFDRYDALETREDLDSLFDVLTSVKDSSGRSAILTTYTVSANISFESLSTGDECYRYETVPHTFGRVAADQPLAYEGAWKLLKDGIRSGLIRPQFHGREHLNVEIIERKLRSKDPGLRINISNRSVAGLTEENSMPGVGFTHAFGISDYADVKRHPAIIAEGLRLFEETFGLESTTFTPPAQKLHPELYAHIESLGLLSIDKPITCVRRLDKNRSRREFNVLGRHRHQGHWSIVRNVVFEPNYSQSIDSVSLALDQIRTAFRWYKPAMVSSHRVNYSGHIEPANRKRGLAELKRLLEGIVSRWPDARFLSMDELVQQMKASP